MSADTFPVLMYHSVVRGYRSDDAAFAVDESVFREQMSNLRDEGFQCTDLAHVLQRVDAAQDVSRHIALTFDDALADFATSAWPALTDIGFGATLYVPTAYVGSTARWLPGSQASIPLLSWSELADLRADGVEIGSHGHVHRPLDEEPSHVVAADLARSRDAIRERTGAEVLSLAYPNGYASKTTRHIAREAGFTSACAIGHSRQALRGDRFAIRRLHVRGTCDPARLVRLVTAKKSGIEGYAKRSAERPWRATRRARHGVRTAFGRGTGSR